MAEFLGHDYEVGISGFRVTFPWSVEDEAGGRLEDALYNYGSEALAEAIEEALEEEIAALDQKAAQYARVILEEWAGRLEDEGGAA